MKYDTWPMVTIYTITYNQCAIVQRTIHGLLEQDYPNQLYEVIVLDDGSNDGTLENLYKIVKTYSEKKIKILYRKHTEDYMSSKCWNECIAAASSKTSVFIQVDDIVPRPDLIKQHIKWHSRGENFVVTGAKFEADQETWKLTDCRRNFLSTSGIPVFCDFQAAWGASLSFAKKWTSPIYQLPYDKPFDERMSGWGYQETEFALRMVKNGARVIYDPKAGVFHRKHTYDSENARNLEREKLITIGSQKNIEYLCQKHGMEELPEWEMSGPISDSIIKNVTNLYTLE